MKNYNKLIFEISKPGRKGYKLPPNDIEEISLENVIPKEYLRKEELKFPEVSEIDLIRHYTALSMKNYGVESGFYPLGSCTMKYNPKMNEDNAGNSNSKNLHPLQPESTIQGSLKLMYELGQMLGEIAGLPNVTLQPAAGSHGELTGLMIIKAYHMNRNDHKRNTIIVPDSAHGTNPASAAVAGFDIVEIDSNSDGSVNLDSLKSVLSDNIAGLMLTNPSTLGLFETNIKEIADLVHSVGGLLYYDGANMNAILSKCRPGDMGFDVMHYNLHKTFSTPHGGGGPGAGPVGVSDELAKFLPVPVIEKSENKYILNYDRPLSIGKVKGFYGNYGILVRAYSYIKAMGSDGLKEVSEIAVLNANYLMNRLKNHYYLPIDKICKHEFVLSGLKDKDNHVTTLDVAKRLLDYGYHPPTVYFPLIVEEALMSEPTETESKETIDDFADALIKIAEEAKTDPDILKTAPHNTIVGRIDEAKAARELVLKYKRD